MTDITELFPECIAFGSQFGPEFRTTLARAYSGRIEANQEWEYPLSRGNVATGIRTGTELEEFRRFFHAAAGQAYTFPYKDHQDFKSSAPTGTPAIDDQTLPTAVAAQTEFQLLKTYTATGRSQSRKIILPVSGTLLVEEDGTPQTLGVDYTVDYQTGILTRASGATGGEVVKWGGEFYVPCRFGDDVWEFVTQNKTSTHEFYITGTATIFEDRQ